MRVSTFSVSDVNVTLSIFVVGSFALFFPHPVKSMMPSKQKKQAHHPGGRHAGFVLLFFVLSLDEGCGLQ